RNLERFADLDVLPIGVADLDIKDADLRPIPAHLRFPLAQASGGGATIAAEFLVRFGRGSVKPLGVFLHHPMGVEDGRDCADRFAHQLQPGEREFAVRFRVIERDDLVLEELVKTARIHFALEIDGAAFDFAADGPAVIAVEALAPPTVEHAQIQSAVGRQFHSAGAAGFERTQWIVQPKINALDEPARDVSVVILDEDHPVFEAVLPAEFVNLLNQRFAAFVLRMRFAGEDELNRPRLVIQQTLEPFLIAEQKRATFVSRESSRETDRENFRIENPVHTPDRFRRFARAFARSADPIADEFNQAQLQLLMRLPQLSARDVGYSPPEIGVGQMFLPIAEILFVERGKLR